jgi:hypothetical protein
VEGARVMVAEINEENVWRVRGAIEAMGTQ